jgi:O-antigen/teichoic acid export membrane protein
LSLQKNVIANFVGQGWRALMGLAFVPVYIRFLGIEAYGLIGIFAILQAWLTLLDLGMTPALSREMARFTAGAHNAESIRDLLRSLEIIGLVIAAAIALGVFASSSWLASSWLRSEHLSSGVISQALAAMGVVTALRFIENIYSSSVAGLQRQVLLNAVTGIMATARGLGAIAILAWVSPTIQAFFAWQCLISLTTIPALAILVYGKLPKIGRAARFSLPALLDVWRFAAGMLFITALALLLTQIDKILLSRLLPLRDFGYYTLAGVIANTLYMLTAPISVAFYPRFTELVTQKDNSALRDVYHQAAQLVTVIAGSAAIVAIVFGRRLLMLWSADATLTQHVAPILAILTAGTLLNVFMVIPYEIQLAHRWTALTIKVNIIAVTLLVPALFWIAPHYGAIGAAWAWVVLNGSYLVFVIYFMHRRLLKDEKWRWYRSDLAMPMLAALVCALACRSIMPDNLGRLGEFFALLGGGASVLAIAVLAAPGVRRQAIRFLRSHVSPLSS